MSSIHNELVAKKYFEDRFYEVLLKIHNGDISVVGVWERGQGYGDAHTWKVEPVDGSVYQSMIDGHDFYIGFWFYVEGSVENKLSTMLKLVADTYLKYLRQEAQRLLDASKKDWLNEHSSTPIG